MYQIIIDISLLQFKDNPTTFNLQIPVKVLSSTRPPLPTSSLNQQIPYRVIFYDSKNNTYNDSQSMKEVFRKLQNKYGELLRSNFSDAGFQEIRDQRQGDTGQDRKKEQKNQDKRDDNRAINQRMQENKQSSIQNNAADLNRNNQTQPPAPSPFTKNTISPSSYQPSTSKTSNPFVTSSSSSQNSNSLFANPSRQSQNYPSSNQVSNPSMNIFQKNNQSNYAYGNNDRNSQVNNFSNNYGGSGSASSNLYSRQGTQNNSASLGLFTDPNKGASTRYGAGRSKKPNLA